jgi:hypothetical protein
MDLKASMMGRNKVILKNHIIYDSSYKHIEMRKLQRWKIESYCASGYGGLG